MLKVVISQLNKVGMVPVSWQNPLNLCHCDPLFIYVTIPQFQGILRLKIVYEI